MGQKTQVKSKSSIKQTKRPVLNYHHGDLRQALIDQAVKELKELKPEALSLRELARAVGVSQAAPYRHFANKEALLAAIIQQGFDLKFKYMKAALENNRDNPREIYFQCGMSYFKMALRHPQHFRLMLSGPVCPSDEYPELQKSASATFVLLRDMIQICQKAGVIGAGDPYHKAMNCWAVVSGFATLYVEGRLHWLGVDEDNAELALRDLLEQYLNGTKSALDSSQKNFAPFQDAKSKEKWCYMEGIRFEPT